MLEKKEEIGLDQAINGLSDFMKYMRSRYKLAHPDGTDGTLYRTLIQEEFNELMAEKAGTAKHFKEELDTSFVTFMESIELNYPFEEGMRELCKEFDSKFYNDGRFSPRYRDDGKLMKGNGFRKGNYDQFFEEK